MRTTGQVSVYKLRCGEERKSGQGPWVHAHVCVCVRRRRSPQVSGTKWRGGSAGRREGWGASGVISKTHGRQATGWLWACGCASSLQWMNPAGRGAEGPPPWGYVCWQPSPSVRCSQRGEGGGCVCVCVCGNTPLLWTNIRGTCVHGKLSPPLVLFATGGEGGWVCDAREGWGWMWKVFILTRA